MDACRSSFVASSIETVLLSLINASMNDGMDALIIQRV
jgi:hypothetical protein